ncbi:hypothetical protein RHGRI_021461 [Rhododendron griersonianum]|uniref:Gnk2-homologous domain-containing protein n=1 Tax=Rhododendron griersonianum TaxID=479676 RepID=A0AAV6JNQ7_9ERIC|nr:hypothetical protein RHGRI_021461 [Rhododendron griersonianum]
MNDFKQAVSRLLDNLRSQAVSGGAHCKFATGNTSGPAFQTICGLIQCTPDLSETDCKNCLQGATANIPQYLGEKIGGRFSTPSCNLRYENYSFFAEIPAAAPPATSDPDIVNAIVLCRGDVDLDTCRSCINDSTIKLPQLLPNYKGAIGWYDYCMLRYSDKSINGIEAFRPSHFRYTYVNASSVNDFNLALRSLLDGLRSQAASGGARRKFAMNNTAGPDFQTIYGLMQCTPGYVS